MQCVILAGDFGTRLQPLTYTRQKVLLPVMNRPMIMHILDALPQSVRTVIIAANYRKEQLRQYFKEHDVGREVIVNDEPQPLGTAGAVKNAESLIDSRFMVVNSDIVSSLDINAILEYHLGRGAMATISLWPVDNVREFGVVKQENDGRITQFVEKPKPEDAPSNLINAGHYCLERKVLDMIPAGTMVSMEKEIFPRIIKETGRFYGFQFKGHWMDVGKKSNYLAAHKLLMEKTGVTSAQGNGCTMDGELRYSCIGNDVVIERGATIRDSVIFDGAHIGDSALVVGSIIGTGSTIGRSASVKGAIVGDLQSLPDHTQVADKMVWDRGIPEGYPRKQVGNMIED